MKKILFSCMLACNAMAMTPSNLESQSLIPQDQRTSLCRIGRFFADIAGTTLGVASGATIAYLTDLNGFLSAVFTMGGASAGAALSDFIFRGCTDHTVTSHQSENDKREKRSEASESLNALSSDSRNQVTRCFEENRKPTPVPSPVPFPKLSSDDESEPVLSPSASPDDEPVSKPTPVPFPDLSSDDKSEAEELIKAFTPPSSSNIVAQMTPNTKRKVFHELQQQFQSETGTPSYTPKVEFPSDSDEEDDPESIAKKITPENAEEVCNCLTPTRRAHMTRSLPPSSPQNRDKMYFQNGDWVQGKYQSDGSVLKGTAFRTITDNFAYNGDVLDDKPHGNGCIKFKHDGSSLSGRFENGKLLFNEDSKVIISCDGSEVSFNGPNGNSPINIINTLSEFNAIKIVLETGKQSLCKIFNHDQTYGILISNELYSEGEMNGKFFALNGIGSMRSNSEQHIVRAIFKQHRLVNNQVVILSGGPVWFDTSYHDIPKNTNIVEEGKMLVLHKDGEKYIPEFK